MVDHSRKTGFWREQLCLLQHTVNQRSRTGRDAGDREIDGLGKHGIVFKHGKQTAGSWCSEGSTGQESIRDLAQSRKKQVGCWCDMQN